jgi:hypothetical protein
MGASKELWKKFRAAQDAKNEDASVAYRRAIERADKGKTADAEWWEKQGDEAMSSVIPKGMTSPREYASR